MEERLYLILDSKGTPLANAVLESPQKAEVLQIRVLGGKEEVVAAHQELQLIGMDDTSPDRVGLIVRQREDRFVIQPTAALGPAARENLRILTSWRGQRTFRAKDLSCGGLAFYTQTPLDVREIVEIVLPVTDAPLVVRAQVLRQLASEPEEDPLYASKFVDLIQDEEAMIRRAVFSIQLNSSN